MKKNLTKFLSVVLCLAMLASLAVSALAEDKTVIHNVNEAYDLVHSTELVSIYNATLYADGKTGRSVYYVVCRGLDFTELDPDQPRSYASAIKIGLSSENNAYIKALSGIVRQVIPAKADVVFVGHSMGGMVIQQAIARKELKDTYNILYTMSIGSPYIVTKYAKEGTLRRIVDRLDPIPFLSIPFLANPLIGDVALETSFQAPLVHFKSYEQGKCWNCYDCLGEKNGSAYIVLDNLLYS